jgi:phosphate transport system permease protein
MNRDLNLGSRKLRNKAALGLCALCALAGIFVLFVILFDLIRHGLEAFNLSLFTENPGPPSSPGGLRGAFLGQALLTLTAAIMGVPLGIMAGTFLSEYGPHLKISRIISNMSDMAISVPSIVIGAFAYALLVKPMGGFNGWAGAVSLALIILPVVIRSTEESMNLTPMALKEAALALGTPQHRVIWDIIYPTAASGMLSGILLGLARITGETAPLLFTSFNSNAFQLSLSHPVPSLTVSLYQYASSPYQSWISLSWAAALALTVWALMLNILGRLAVKPRTK